jgi:hypothetical protein
VTRIPADERYRVYWDAIRRKVCAVCLDGRDDGTCGLTGRTCAIESHLPRVVDTLVGIESDRMDEYFAAVEAEVCNTCSNQDERGYCGLRHRGQCSLYSYLYLVVEAVEEAKLALGEPVIRRGA